MTGKDQIALIHASSENEARKALQKFHEAKVLSNKQDQYDHRADVASIKAQCPWMLQVQEHFDEMKQIIEPVVAFAESISLDDIPMVVNGKRMLREDLVKEIKLVRDYEGVLATISLWLQYWRQLDFEDDAREMLRTEWQRQFYTQGFQQYLRPWAHHNTVEDISRTMSAHTTRIVELLQALASEMESPDFPPSGKLKDSLTTFARFSQANPDGGEPNVVFDEVVEPTAADTVAAIQRRSDLDSEPVPGEE